MFYTVYCICYTSVNYCLHEKSKLSKGEYCCCLLYEKYTAGIRIYIFMCCYLPKSVRKIRI